MILDKTEYCKSGALTKKKQVSQELSFSNEYLYQQYHL